MDILVHYYECRWVSGEDELSEKQKGKTFKNVLVNFYHRLGFQLIIDAYPKDEIKNLVGVITPFKAQAKYIQMELKKKMPKEYSDINVGTVHTFQGAERRIIIFSSVYGKLDGCFFIDNNKSLMNVAVSRAKDHFFVFGELDCLKETSGNASASGLLRRRISSNPI